MIRTKVISPDRAAFTEVSKILSRSGASVAAVSNGSLTHTITSKITDKLTEQLLALGAEIEMV